MKLYSQSNITMIISTSRVTLQNQSV
uniref:Uncharacterized protein n=1 Tax=Tetranychus urticae TaxID=32264 RepID=T1JSJ9_TETUR